MYIPLNNPKTAIVILLAMLIAHILVPFFRELLKTHTPQSSADLKFRFYRLLFFEFEIAVILFILVSSFSFSSSEEDISIRIENISNNLSAVSIELVDIQTELESRISIVENLKKEAEIAENMISLSEEQVNAVQQKINEELEASSGKNTVITILVSAFFFILGLIVPSIIKFLK